jgi:glycosyltransferase involved in cell wall biosynthesis
MQKNRRRKVVIAGQVPPPVGGQAVMIERLLTEMKQRTAVETVHLSFRFTRHVQQARRAGFGKAIELLAVLSRLLRIRFAGPIDLLVYPIGGPQLVPTIRDLCILPFVAAASRRFAIHFHAGGIAEFLPKLPPPIRGALKALCSRASAGIVMTEFGRRDPESLGIERVLTVPHALDDTYESSAVLRGVGLPKLLYVGHLCPDKGTTALLTAVAALRNGGSNCELVLMGECLAPYTAADLKSDIERHGLQGCVHLPGVLSGREKWQQLAAADLFVFPSVAPESFGLVLVEAMMWALPIVATDWRGSREVVGEDVGGICFRPEPGLSGALTGALIAALEEQPQWRTWGAKNRERYQLLFKNDPLHSRLAAAVETLAI